MIYIVTHERSGFDKHSQEMANALGVNTIHTRRYFADGEEEELLDKLANTTECVHISNQNFARYAFCLQKPYIVTVHDVIRNFYDFDGESGRDRFLLRLDEYFIKQAMRVIAVSSFTADEVSKWLNIPRGDIDVVYNGVDHNIFKPGDKVLPFSYILYVGSERPRKNLPVLIEALAIVRKSFPNLKLVKVGGTGRDERFREPIDQTVHKFNLQGAVQFVDGYIDDQTLARYYRSAKALVYPSLMEGFGLPPLEAMACGCPVVCSDIAASREVVQDAGLFFDPNDPEDCALKIIQMIQEPSDGYTIPGVGRAGNFRWDIAAKETRRIYNECGY